jgi:hypothetical protein
MFNIEIERLGGIRAYIKRNRCLNFYTTYELKQVVARIIFTHKLPGI